MNNITRHVAMLAAIAGVIGASGHQMASTKALVSSGLGVIVRVLVAWYLARGEIADQFKAPPTA
jgi:hypothetical protein